MILINGTLLNESPLGSNLHSYLNFDEGFSFGKGLFETILLKENIPVLLKEHILRLNNGAKTLNIKNEISEEYILNIIEKFNLSNCVLKIILSDCNTIVSTRDIPYNSDHYLEGFKLTVSNVLRNETSLLTYYKWTGYLENILEKQKAHKLGFDDIIFLNSKGYITETSTANIFFIKDKIIYTPKIQCGLLKGIIREWVLKNFEVKEGNYFLDDLLQADEIFITNSIVGIIKINTLNHSFFPSNIITSYISNKYFEFLNNLK